MITIIIPVFNREQLVIETLVSIQNQTFQNWECIIVDDGSTDNTIEVIAKHIAVDHRFQLHERPKNLKKGPSACRNFAFSKSKGQFIQFFDSDDIMHPAHLERKRNNIHDNDFIVCKLQEFSGEFSAEGSLKDKYPDSQKVTNIFESFVTGEFYMLMMVAPLWKKEAITPFMPMREDLHILEDHELYARILFHNTKYAILNEELIFYRVGQSSLLHSFYNNISFGLASYFEAKKTVLRLSNNPKIKYFILKETLSLFRLALAQKQFGCAKKCLQFCAQQQLAYSFILKLKMLKIHLLFALVLLTKRGDTYLKNHFKV